MHIRRDAREALKRLREGERFDLIFCDLMMPAMSGADFHAALVDALPELVAKVVFLTGARSAAARASSWTRSPTC